MTARYSLSFETADGSVEAPYHFMASKRLAIQSAKRAARGTVCADVVAIWVDDTKTDQGVQRIWVKRAA